MTDKDTMIEPVRILIADPNSTQALNLKTFLDERGFAAFVVTDGEEAKKAILKLRPQIALVELTLPKLNALQILKELKSTNATELSLTKFIIISQQTNINNIKECMKFGASDFLLRPLEVEDIISRLVFHLQPSRSEERATSLSDSTSNLYLHLIELVLRQVNQSENMLETLLKLTQMSAMVLKSVRTSVVRCDQARFATVKASSDDLHQNEWTLDLKKYPEILFVINTEKTLVIENLASDPTLNQIKKYFSNITFNSMIVIPLYSAPSQFYGVLTIRMPADRAQILKEELQFSQILAQCMSLTLKLHKA